MPKSLWEMAHLHISYTHPPIHLKPSVDATQQSSCLHKTSGSVQYRNSFLKNAFHVQFGYIISTGPDVDTEGQLPALFLAVWGLGRDFIF